MFQVNHNLYLIKIVAYKIVSVDFLTLLKAQLFGWVGNWYGSDLQILEDLAHQVLKKFHDVDPVPQGGLWDQFFFFKIFLM